MTAPVLDLELDEDELALDDELSTLVTHEKVIPAEQR